MEGTQLIQGVTLGGAALDVVMPLHLTLDASGHVISAGPTIRKLIGTDGPGRHLTALFDLRRPQAMTCAEDLTAVPRLALTLRQGARTGFKGVAVPMGQAGGVLLNLSFGPAVAEAVRDHRLSDTDFAPTDLAIELLFLAEARAAIMSEIDSMTRRLRRARMAAEEQANTDALTGLRNRRAMDRRLAALIASATPFALVHLDLDFFKEVNDTQGHAAGDRLLAGFADVLRQAVRDGDLVARVGGDEFMLLLPGVTRADEVARLGQRLLHRLGDPATQAAMNCRVSASIGAVLSDNYPQPEADLILSVADEALYRSKRAGRGRMTIDMGAAGERVVGPEG